jgi:hypothetical protein
MLQIIAFQLSALIWLVAALNPVHRIKAAGIVLAIVFALAGVVETAMLR